jgi:hypothetical protein
MKRWYKSYAEADKAFKKLTGHDYAMSPAANSLRMFHLGARYPSKRKNRYFLGTEWEWLNAA